MEFSSRSMSFQVSLCTSLGLTPANIKRPMAGRHSLCLGIFAVFRRFLICGNERGEISLSIILLLLYELYGIFVAPFATKSKFKTRRGSIVRALLNWLAVVKVSDSHASQSAMVNSEKLHSASPGLAFIRRLPR